jgi:hypothetical protein
MQKLFSGKIAGGRFIPDMPYQYSIRYCALEGKRITEAIGLETRKGTAKQRSYYWAVIIPICAEITGYTHAQAHEALKWEHLRVRREDKRLDTVRSTESLTTVEKEAYYENCRRTITDMGGYCPLPNEVTI